MRVLRVVLISLWIFSTGHAFAANEAELAKVRLLMQEGQLSEAHRQLDRFLAQHPGHADGRFLKGLMLVNEGRTREAIDVFAALTRDYPDLPEPYNNLAVLYAAEGDYEKARESLLVAINTHPSYATAHENLGDLYAKMATVAYDKAFSLDETNQTAKAKLALVNDIFVEHPPPQPMQGASRRDSQADSAAVMEAVTSTTEPAETSAADSEDRVRSALADWAAAWSDQDVEGYLDHYADAFEPSRGLARSRWEQQRRQRLIKPRYIQVSLSNVTVRMESADRARVSFVQSYRSNTYSDRTRKTVLMTRTGNDWKILSERLVR